MSAPSQALTAAEVLALPAVVDVWPTVGRIYGIGRTATYELARADALPVPVIRIGRKCRARRSDLLKSLGIEDSTGVAAPALPTENAPHHTSSH
ncbi:DNA-binding protein [Streptomyces orinoci]|uniref:DNA-binding protein n=1 Tax=Streptomyces orinoci TaxID=67339 RepID=A0ABV3JTQ5_STRON|nr:DNA-binding protein [Streptomyces orinoci]